MWGVPVVAIAVLLVLTFFELGSRGTAGGSGGGTPLNAGAMRAPDISSMSPEERVNRLFNQVMRLSSEGKADSAAFFAPMALGAMEAIRPMSAHARYDMGIVALVTGDNARAAAQSDSILAERPSHLLGLALAARAADARGNAAAGRAFRQKLLAAEPAERAGKLQEYTDHDADIRAAVLLARPVAR